MSNVLLERDNGGLIALGAIKSAYRQGWSTSVRTTDGESVEGLGSVESLRVQSLPVIPAQPGWSLLVFIAGGQNADAKWEPYAARQPIIAWRIDGQAALPVTVRENSYISNAKAVLSPDGKVFELDGDTFESIDAWIKDVVAVEELEAKAAAAVKPARETA